MLESNPAGLCDVAYSPDGSRIALGDEFDNAWVYDARTYERAFVLRGENTRALCARSVAFSPDGTMLATQTPWAVHIWALDIGTLLDVARRNVTRPLSEAECSLYLHVDWRTAHHVRLLLDRVFGAERFLNELVWAYDYGGRARDRWPRKHDTILWYAKGERWTFDREAIDRVPYLAPGLVGPEKAARGKLPTDVWWMTIVPPA